MTEIEQNWMPACQRREVIGVEVFSSFIFWPKQLQLSRIVAHDLVNLQRASG